MACTMAEGDFFCTIRWVSRQHMALWGKLDAQEVLDLTRKLNASFNHVKCVANKLAKKIVSLQSLLISSGNLVLS